MLGLSNNIYYQRYKLLHDLWLQDQRAFTLLAPREQIELHSYFKLVESLTSDELVAHRQVIMTEDSSLANRAGKAYAMFVDRLTGKAPSPRRPAPHVQGVLMRPDPDYRQLARVCVELARMQIRKSRR